MVTMMDGLTRLCCYCHEITERTCDGDRLACSMCGRPYPVAPTAHPAPFALRPADLTHMTKHDDSESGTSER